MNNQTEVAEKNQVLAIIEQSGLEESTAENLKLKFSPFIEQALEWNEKAKTLKVTDVTQVREMRMAREGRLALKDIRVRVEKTRKELKEDSLRKGKAIDLVANLLKSLIEPTEQYLETQEKFAEIQEANRKEEQRKLRTALLEPFGVQTEFYKLDEMDETTFQNLYQSSKNAHENRIAEEKRLEEDRIAREQQEVKARERIRLENERLKAEAEERERIMREERMKAEAERKAAEEAAAKKLAEEKAKAEAEQKAMREEAQKKLAAERAERERVEAELKAKQEAEAKARAEAEAAAEAELSKGDKEKFQDIINSLESIKGKYTFKSKKYKALAASVDELIDKTINWAISKQ